MFKSKIVFILAIEVVVIIIVISFILFFPKTTPTATVAPPPTPSTNKSAIESPVNVKSPLVKSVQIRYVITGIVKSLENRTGVFFVTFNDSSIPEMQVTEKSYITKVEGQNKTQVKITTIKPGDTITVFSLYNVTENMWQVFDMLPTDQKLSTPTPTP